MANKTKFEIDSATLFGDDVLLGIASHESDYRVAWLLNNALKWNLSHTDQGFVYTDEDDIIYTLLSNLQPERIILNSWKTTDYLLYITGNSNSFNKQELISSIQQIQDIIMVFEIELTKKIKASLASL